MNRAFSADDVCVAPIPGASPQAIDDAAPLALDFTLALPAGQRLQKMMLLGQRLYRLVRFVVIWLPAFLFVCALVLPRIPHATGLFSDSAGPWYQPITSPLFLAALLYSYPVTLLCTRLVSDEMFFSPGYYLVLAVYTAASMFVLRSIFWFFERHAKKEG